MQEVMAMAQQAMAAPPDSPARFGARPSDPVDAKFWEESKRQHRRFEGAASGRVFGAPWQGVVEQFRCPVLLVWGTTGLVTSETAEEAHGLSPLLQDVQIDAGHSIRYGAFEPYVAAVAPFLAAAPLTAP